MQHVQSGTSVDEDVWQEIQVSAFAGDFEVQRKDPNPKTSLVYLYLDSYLCVVNRLQVSMIHTASQLQLLLGTKLKKERYLIRQDNIHIFYKIVFILKFEKQNAYNSISLCFSVVP